MADKAKRKAEKRRSKTLSWKARITLSGFLLWTVLGTILAVTGSLGTYALYTLYQSKLTDTWAILFLELERSGSLLLQRLEKFATSAPTSDQAAAGTSRQVADIILKVDEAGLARVRGDIPDRLTLKDFNLAKAELRARWNVLQFAGRDYLGTFIDARYLGLRLGEAMPAGQYLLLRRLDVSGLFDTGNDDEPGVDGRSVFYLITSEGRVVYTNRADINSTNHAERPLVQKFVANPLKHGQLEFQGPDGPAYGFFYEVPDTNVMMFVETSKRVALSEVEALAIQFGMVLLATMAIVGIALQFPLSSLVVAPMRELVRVADEVGDGNFEVYPSRNGLGELAILSESFTEMAKNLITRDRKIQGLLVEQQEKVRLEDELAIAHSIQNNFLIQNPLPAQSGVEVAAQYTPATEVAGDWYGYSFDPETGQSVFAIADVSGHGAGSAMFTAIVAATFEEMTGTKGRIFPATEFALRLNRLILKLGHGQMHATLILATYLRGSSQVEVLNAGHPFPILIHPEETQKKSESVMARSDLLGMRPDFKPAVEKVPFPKGTSLFMYTDGLIEGSPDHRIYSERRLGKAAKITATEPVSHLVIKVYDDWREHMKGQQPLDDVCLMAVRAAA